MTKAAMRGNYEMWSEQQVIVCRLKHSWSERTALQYADTMKKEVLSFNGKPWANLVLLAEWDIGVPAIEGIIADLLLWNLQRNFRRLAMVLGNNPVQGFQIDRILNKKIESDFQSNFFTSEAIANNWLSNQGFQRKPSD